MGDEVLLEALSAMKSETTASANEPVGDVTPPTQAGSEQPASDVTPSAETAPQAETITSAEPAEPSTAAEGEPPPSGDPSPPAEGGEPQMPKQLADAWALVERRMSAVEARERQAKTQQTQLEEYAAKLQSGQVEQATTDFHAKVRQDPLGVLSEAGVSWHNLASMIMTGQVKPEQNAPAPPQEAQTGGAVTEERIAELVAKALQDHVKQQNAASTDLWYQQQIELALTKPEYQLVSRALPNAKDAIWQEAVRLSQEGETLPPETVISTIQERERGRLKKLLGMQDVTSTLGFQVMEATPQEESPKQATSQPAEPKQPETLGANAGAPSSSPKTQEEKPLSDHELLQMALQHVRRE